jgi:hypothetical protein
MPTVKPIMINKGKGDITLAIHALNMLSGKAEHNKQTGIAIDTHNYYRLYPRFGNNPDIDTRQFTAPFVNCRKR